MKAAICMLPVSGPEGKNCCCFWNSCCYYSSYGCNLYYCPDYRCYYYFCVPDDCYYPVTYCPYGCYKW